MDASELSDLWERNNDRPAWVREHREAIQEHTDTDEAIPNGSLAEVRAWLDSYKGVVTRQLGEAAETTTTDEESA